ncbi:MAG: hypothetical protein [Bacteriophage sp.]|nr:MAG: hypothetical protein [Bacteriophage sp.]
MKACKGFDKNLMCRGFQYEVGGEYTEETAELCNRGPHACENPLDTLRYYRPGDSRYCEVEIEANGQRSSYDSKVCGKHIKIGAEIGLKGVINAGVRFVFDKCGSASEEKASGWSGNAAASGESGTASVTGPYGKASALGEQCLAVAWGQDSLARGTVGNWIVVSERDDDGNIIDAKIVRVDGESVKENTWYTLQNGEISEVEE